MRTALKRAAEFALTRLGPVSLFRPRMRGRSLILAYHNIVPDGQSPGGDRAVHLPAATFRAELALLARYAEVLPLPVVLAEPSAPRQRPRVAITFDDAYTGALTVGVSLLREQGFPATVFVAPAFLDGRGFWWDEVVAPGHGSGFDPDFRDIALSRLQGDDALVRAEVRASGGWETTAPIHARCASVAALETALEYPGLTLASHTWSHPNLTVLDHSRLYEELARPLAWLRRFGDRALPMLSYPYGLTSPSVEHAARAGGYQAGFTVTGGWCPPGGIAPFAVPRLNIPAGLSASGFEVRLAGLLAGSV